jgi:ribosome biogenesis GTPase
VKGLVIKSTGSWYQIQTESGDNVACRIQGKFRLKGIKTTNPIF